MSRNGLLRLLSRIGLLKHLPLPRWMLFRSGDAPEGSGKWLSPYKALSKKLCDAPAAFGRGWCNQPMPCKAHQAAPPQLCKVSAPFGRKGIGRIVCNQPLPCRFHPAMEKAR
jgi:hypothetical protein